MYAVAIVTVIRKNRRCSLVIENGRRHGTRFIVFPHIATYNRVFFFFTISSDFSKSLSRLGNEGNSTLACFFVFWIVVVFDLSAIPFATYGCYVYILASVSEVIMVLSGKTCPDSS